MGRYEVPLSMSLFGFGIWTRLDNFHMCGIMLLLRSVINMLVRNMSPIGPIRFRCLIFSLSRPLWIVSCTLFYCLLDLSCGVMLYPCMFCVTMSMDLVVLCL